MLMDLWFEGYLPSVLGLISSMETLGNPRLLLGIHVVIPEFFVASPNDAVLRFPLMKNEHMKLGPLCAGSG